MSRLLLSIAFFGVLLSSAYARMGLGMWEATSQQEGVEEYLKFIHGEDTAAKMWQKGTEIMTGWSYNDHTDHFVHWVSFWPSQVSYSFAHRDDRVGTTAFGDDLIEYSYSAEAEGETGIVHGNFKVKGGDKSWTKDYEFKEDGNMQLIAKAGDKTMKILFRPVLSTRAQGSWEATSEGKNLDKLGEVFKGGPAWPKDEKFRICIKREDDHYVKTVNVSSGIHKHEFKVNKPGTMKVGDKEVQYTTKYDMALDAVNATLKSGDDEIKIKYTHDDRGAYGTYKKGDIEIQRFYKRVIPDELLGTFEFTGKQVNGETFHKALLGADKSAKKYSGAKKIEFKCEGDNYSETVYYEGDKKMKFDFVLGELGHVTTPDATTNSHFFSFHARMRRQVLRGDFWSTEKPHRYFAINFEWESDNDLVLTYSTQNVMAKRWFKRV